MIVTHQRDNEDIIPGLLAQASAEQTWRRFMTVSLITDLGFMLHVLCPYMCFMAAGGLLIATLNHHLWCLREGAPQS